MSSSIEQSYNLHDFYKNKTILITGSTGFLGLVIVEKLLRSFPEIKELLIIIRSKRGKSSQQRISEYFDNEIFNNLKQHNPQIINKVCGLEGDVTYENCGLTPEDIRHVHEEVNIVIHCAATVRFTDPIRTAVTINIKGTNNMLKLSKAMKFIQSFVYVSTAFSNCNEKVLEEIIYPHPIAPEKLMSLVDILDDETLAKITPILLNSWPNTYTYTKNASENLVYSYKNHIPIAIFRPSIISATCAEPIQAWVNKYVGPYGYMTTTGLGFNRVVHCSQPNSNSNLVPCDYVANAIIAVAWNIGIQRVKMAEIINYSSDKNPVSWRTFTVKMLSGYTKTPFSNAVWYPINMVIENRRYYDFLHFVLQMCPAYFADIAFILTNKKPFYVPFMKKIQKNLDDVDHFCNHDILLRSENIYLILNKMSEEDKRLLNFDMRTIDWDAYFLESMRGIKQFLLHEDMSENALRKARNKCFWLFILHQLFKIGLLSTVIYILKYIYKRIK